MTIETFKASLNAEAPPDLSQALRALWYEGKGDWHGAHNLLQDDNSSEGAWVHAYLHRKEGDAANAAYWYTRAGKSPVRSRLHEEWLEVLESLLS